MLLNAYLPDPSKWIETSSSKSNQKAKERPLVAWKHGIATPTSVPRSSTARSRALSSASQVFPIGNDTPITVRKAGGDVKGKGPASARQRTLEAFFTPPMTASGNEKGKGKPHSGINTASPKPRSYATRRDRAPELGSRLKIAADMEFWASEEDEPGPSSRHPNHTSSSAWKTGRYRNMNPTPVGAKKGEHTWTRTEQRKKVSLSAFSSGELSDLPPEYSSDHTPPRPLIPTKTRVPITSVPIPSSQLGTASRRTPIPITGVETPSMITSTPPLPIHSELAITPYPESVLQLHGRLCGPDPEQTKRIRSPWKRVTSEERRTEEEAWRLEDAKKRDETMSETKERQKERRMLKKDKPKGEVDLRIMKVLKEGAGLKRGRSFVDLSDGEEVIPRVQKTTPLSPLRLNAIKKVSPTNLPWIVKEGDGTADEPLSKRSKADRENEVASALTDKRSGKSLERFGTEARTDQPVLELSKDQSKRRRPSLFVEVDRRSRPALFPMPSPPRLSSDPSLPERPPGRRTRHRSPRYPLGSPTNPPRANRTSQASQPHPAEVAPDVYTSSPTKRRSAHHTVTPPKSSSAKNTQLYRDLLSSPPLPQPVFASGKATDWKHLREVGPEEAKGFVPVDMAAETLLTWSLGPGYASRTTVLPNVVQMEEASSDPAVVGDIGPVDVEMGEKPSEQRSSASGEGDPYSVSWLPAPAPGSLHYKLKC